MFCTSSLCSSVGCAIAWHWILQYDMFHSTGTFAHQSGLGHFRQEQGTKNETLFQDMFVYQSGF